MEELIFKNVKLEFKLIAQSPLIHFQPNDCGATLRASEVKPKLDRFLINKENITKENNKIFFVDPKHDALNYKMKIISEKCDIKKYSIFYGNQKKSEDKEKKGIFSNPTVTIICCNKELRGLIENNIVEFFYVTNFGTMQDKGFGSFIIEGTSGEKNDYMESLKQYYNTKCYELILKKNYANNNIEERSIDQFKIIKSFYEIMKSGQNMPKRYIKSYLTIYMKKNFGIDGEKKWLKLNKIGPNICKNEKNKKNEKIELNKPRYIRALLGISNSVSWNNEVNRKVDILIESQDIKRLSSPIFFKVIDKHIFVLGLPIDEEIYGKEFEFKRGKKSGKIKIPEKEDLQTTNNKFDTQDFLENYFDYFYKNLNKTPVNKLVKN